MANVTLSDEERQARLQSFLAELSVLERQAWRMDSADSEKENESSRLDTSD